MDDIARSLGDGYRIERDLGTCFGWRTFVGFDEVLSRRVVIRILEGLSNSPIFRKAMKGMVALAHPGVIPVLGVGAESDARMMYVSGYVDGPALDQILSDRKALSVAEACRIAGEVADVLHYAHERGIMHHDLSPHHIHIDSRALVGGLGVADAIRRALADLTGPDYIGNPAYVAPEQVLGKSLDARTDVYMLGALLYEMVAGRPAFTGRTAQETIVAKLMGDAPDVRERRRDVPTEVAEIVARCLEREPANRMASAADVAQSLRAL